MVSVGVRITSMVRGSASIGVAHLAAVISLVPPCGTKFTRARRSYGCARYIKPARVSYSIYLLPTSHHHHRTSTLLVRSRLAGCVSSTTVRGVVTNRGVSAGD